MVAYFLKLKNSLSIATDFYQNGLMYFLPIVTTREGFLRRCGWAVKRFYPCHWVDDVPHTGGISFTPLSEMAGSQSRQKALLKLVHSHVFYS